MTPINAVTNRGQFQQNGQKTALEGNLQYILTVCIELISNQFHIFCI